MDGIHVVCRNAQLPGSWLRLRIWVFSVLAIVVVWAGVWIGSCYGPFAARPIHLRLPFLRGLPFVGLHVVCSSSTRLRANVQTRSAHLRTKLTASNREDSGGGKPETDCDGDGQAAVESSVGTEHAGGRSLGAGSGALQLLTSSGD